MRFIRRRLWRLVAVGTVATAGLLVAADIVMLQVFEARAATGIARSTAGERAWVDLGGSPFLPSYLRGRLGSVEVEALGMSGSGLRVDRFDLQMSDVIFKRGRALALVRSRHATRMRIDGKELIGRFEIVERDLFDFIRPRVGGVAALRITEAGVEVSFEGVEEGTPPTRYLPRMVDGPGGGGRRVLALRLVGEAGIPPAHLHAARLIEGVVDLPPAPEGLQFDVRLGNGVFAVEFAGTEAYMWIGSGRPDPEEDQ